MFSVIIPMFNAQDTILGTVQSVLNQRNFTELVRQIIIVDDGSSDCSLKVINAYLQTACSRGDVKVLVSENRGPSHARNLGAAHATAPWLAFLDADDSWLPNKLSVQATFLKGHTPCKFLAAATSSTGIVKGQPEAFQLSSRHFFRRAILNTPSVVIDRKVFVRCGGFNEEHRYGEDAELFIRLVASVPSYFVNEVLVQLAPKRAFGEAGLSANLREMHLSVLRNLRFAVEIGFIPRRHFLLLYAWEFVRYFRRLYLSR